MMRRQIAPRLPTMPEGNDEIKSRFPRFKDGDVIISMHGNYETFKLHKAYLSSVSGYLKCLFEKHKDETKFLLDLNPSSETRWLIIPIPEPCVPVSGYLSR